MNDKEVIKVEKPIKPDLFGEFEQLNNKYKDKFLNELHPLMQKYHDITGNDFEYRVVDEIIIKYNGSMYWVCEGTPGSGQSGLWFIEQGIDIYGRKFGGEHDGWFYLVARLCCKYEKEIRSKIEFDLKEIMT